MDQIRQQEQESFDDGGLEFKSRVIEPSMLAVDWRKYDILLCREMSLSNIPPADRERYISLIVDKITLAEYYLWMGGPYVELALQHFTELKSKLKLWGSINAKTLDNLLAPPQKYTIRQNELAKKGGWGSKLIRGRQADVNDYYETGGE